MASADLHAPSAGSPHTQTEPVVRGVRQEGSAPIGVSRRHALRSRSSSCKEIPPFLLVQGWPSAQLAAACKQHRWQGSGSSSAQWACGSGSRRCTRCKHFNGRHSCSAVRCGTNRGHRGAANTCRASCCCHYRHLLMPRDATCRGFQHHMLRCRAMCRSQPA